MFPILRFLMLSVAIAMVQPPQIAFADESAEQKLNTAFRIMGEGRNEEALAMARTVPEARCSMNQNLLRLEIFAETHSQLKKFPEALIYFDRNIAIREKSIAALKLKNKLPTDDEKRLLSMAYTHKAKALYMLRRLNDSLVCLDKALAVRPSNASALSDRAKVLLNLGRSKEAVEEFSKILANLRAELNTSNNAARILGTRAAVIQCLYNRALAYQDLGMMEQSKRDRYEADKLTREL